MSKRAVSLAVAAACLLLAVQMIRADRAEIDAKISKAVSYLGQEGDSAKKAFILVVDAVSLAAPATTYPSEFGESIEKAKKIVLAFDEATEKGLGVVSLGSKMIDPPVVKRAQKTIETALASGLISENWKDQEGPQ